jgi:hypothetical protein
MSNRISSNASVGCGVFKNAAILFTIILISVGCADSSAQSTNQDGSRLVGTWVVVSSAGDAVGDGDKTVRDGETWVFNSDGTGSRSDYRFKYAAIAGSLKMRGCNVTKDGTCYQSSSKNFSFVISNDGKTLFMDTEWLRKSSGK